jgi:hypothetical protein
LAGFALGFFLNCLCGGTWLDCVVGMLGLLSLTFVVSRVVHFLNVASILHSQVITEEDVATE